ncbi:saponin hydrolase precursor [Aaosphaeria arxii CBS 175.79]|uniref:Saponin hydrolase n=1 Tax=Aaosphaeria arxii CBS 175.79 TaxID=1450172 RepID=A0A6A5XN24_9PLEO|nr:saponin hydrolase precursor [Aaosphaeria arxii CBS 175.79]KAF2014323.1 saponin hydrolase precursor [Aaosphaeria arxii CBS 175.79]
MLFHTITVACYLAAGTRASSILVREESKIPSPPAPEPIEVTEIPLPPAIPEGAACTVEVNPRGTGCITTTLNKMQAGTFTRDQNHIIASVLFVGAPDTIYDGTQIIIINAQNTTFSNGDPWRCITCGVPPENSIGRIDAMLYPRAFNDGKRILAGPNIIETGGYDITDDRVSPEKTFIYPIRWNVAADGSGPGGAIRELRLHPDDTHLAWSSFVAGGEFSYYGRLKFTKNPTAGTPLAPRYDLEKVSLLHNDKFGRFIDVKGDELIIDRNAIIIGELRGFSGTGHEITYLGYPWESCNLDVFAVSLQTGKIRRLTSHPEYVDPVDISADDKWTVIQDTRGTDRQMWLSGMRGIPPIIDLVVSAAASSTRNNGERRFFQPYLLDRYGDRGNYFGQRVNAAGDGSNGAVNDPNWNGKADPHFSLDGTRIVYHQDLLTAPACGGENPLPCPVLNAQGGRRSRIMLAWLVSRSPQRIPKFEAGPDWISWATPYVAGSPPPSRYAVKGGTYKHHGNVSGTADVVITTDKTGAEQGVTVVYKNYSDGRDYILNGYENATITRPTEWDVVNDWYSRIVQTGVVKGVKETSKDGFHLSINVLENIFNANGTLTTTLNGKVYKQPQNKT